MSQTRASAGTATSFPTALMNPSRMTMVPTSMTSPGLVTTLPPTNAWMPERQRSKARWEDLAGWEHARQHAELKNPKEHQRLGLLN